MSMMFCFEQVKRGRGILNPNPMKTFRTNKTRAFEMVVFHSRQHGDIPKTHLHTEGTSAGCSSGDCEVVSGEYAICNVGRKRSRSPQQTGPSSPLLPRILRNCRKIQQKVSHSKKPVEEKFWRTPKVLQNFGSQTQLFKSCKFCSHMWHFLLANILGHKKLS